MELEPLSHIGRQPAGSPLASASRSGREPFGALPLVAAAFLLLLLLLLLLTASTFLEVSAAGSETLAADRVSGSGESALAAFLAAFTLERQSPATGCRQPGSGIDNDNSHANNNSIPESAEEIDSVG